MEIIFNNDDHENIKVEINGFDKDLEDIEDVFFDVSASIATIVGEMVFKIAEKAAFDEKKSLAKAILDFSNTMVDAYYDDMEKQHEKAKKEVELYEIMVECYEDTLRNYDIDEDEIISDAQTMSSRFVVEQNGGTYHCNIVFGDKVYTFGKVPAGLTGKKMDLLTWKASLAAIVLFDKAFPDDESKHPLRPYNKFNFYQDLIDEL